MKAQEKEKKNKRRGLIVTFLFHGVLIAIALIPYTQYIYETESTDIELAENQPKKIYTELNTEVVMSHTTSNSSSRSSSQPLPTTEPDPKPSAEEPKEVVTEENIVTETVVVPETPNNNENFIPIPLPFPFPYFGNPNGNGNGGNGNGNENLGGNGNGDHGNGTWGNDNGNGKFSRKVISRPEAELKTITKKRGTMVIRLAIDRDGKVLDSKYMKELSSIKEDKLGKTTAKVALKYKFDRDYKVAEIQYCNITIIFEE